MNRSFGQWLWLSPYLGGIPHASESTPTRTGSGCPDQTLPQPVRDAPIHLDGHQHIHLVPIVPVRLDRVAKTASRDPPYGRAATHRPALALLGAAIRESGFSWLVLQVLSRKPGPPSCCGLASNQSFAGVLFTGQMTGAPIKAARRELSSAEARPGCTAPLLLAHPGAPLDIDLVTAGFCSMPAASSWRQHEWRALQDWNAPNEVVRADFAST